MKTITTTIEVTANRCRITTEGFGFNTVHRTNMPELWQWHEAVANCIANHHASAMGELMQCPDPVASTKEDQGLTMPEVLAMLDRAEEESISAQAMARIARDLLASGKTVQLLDHDALLKERKEVAQLPSHQQRHQEAQERGDFNPWQSAPGVVNQDPEVALQAQDDEDAWIHSIQP